MPRSRLAVTRLEDRSTPATVGLDPTFGTGGRFALSDVLNVTGDALPQLVESLPDGRVVVGTTATDASGNQDFLVFRLTVDGALDPTFGSGGRVTVGFDLGGANADVLNALTVLSDGRILAAGYAERAGGDTDMAVVRLTANGQLDAAFDADGKATVAFNGGGQNRDAAAGVAADAAGRVVLGGYAEAATGSFDFAAARLTAAGALDTTFSGDGRATVAFNLTGGTGEDKAAAVAVGPANTVVLAGGASNGSSSTATAVARLLENGNPDPALNGTGQRTFAAVSGTAAAANAAAAVTVAADGRILLAGTTGRTTDAANTDMYVGRLTTAGAPDTTFGSSGFTVVRFDRGGSNADVGNALAVDAAGNVLVAGSAAVSSGNFDFGIARLTAAGVIDTTFGQAGRVVVPFDRGGAKADAATDVAVTADGRILLAGVVETAAETFDAGVARLTTVAGLPSTLVVGGGAGGSAATFTANTSGQYSAAGTFTPFGTNVIARTAVGDVNGDGVADTIYAVGPGGGSLVRVVNGATGQDLVAATSTFEAGFTGGLFVAAGDIDGDGIAEVVVSPDVGGGGRVQAFAVQSGALVQRANFFGIDDTNFRGGARVAVGDVNGDGAADVVVGAGFGGGPRVAVFDGSSMFSRPSPARLIGDFFAFPGSDATTLRNGVFVAAGDLTGDGRAELVFGGGPGGGPRVFALDGATLLASGSGAAQAGPVANFFVAGDTASRGGIRVAVKDADADGRADLVTGSGDGLAARVRVYLGKSFPAAGEPAAAQELAPFGGAVLANGVFVG